MANNAFWAAVPLTADGTVNGSSGKDLNNRLSEFLFDDSADVFYGQFNNEKYDRSGGVVSFSRTASISCYDLNKLETADSGLKAGDLWEDLKLVYDAEGDDADAADAGNMTVTMKLLQIESVSVTDGGGRLVLNATGRVVSDDGTDPLTYSIADS